MGNDAAVRILGYPPEGKGWWPVDPERFEAAPYNRICELRCNRSGTAPRMGSGWHIESGIIQTVAHNLEGVYEVEVRFPFSDDWIATTQFEITPGYQVSNRPPRKCSAEDLATLAIKVPPSHVPSDAFQLPDDEDGYRVAGYVDGVLVEHVAKGRVIHPFITYETHTDWGHSGCPVFHRGRFVGIHVGLFAQSRTYLPADDVNIAGYRNSCIRF